MGTTCGTCKFYFEIRPGDENTPAEGQCRKYPPRLVPLMKPGGSHVGIDNTWFPEVQDSTWCGERSAREEW